MNAARNWFASHFMPPRPHAVYDFSETKALCKNLADRQRTQSPFPDASRVDEHFAADLFRAAAERIDHPPPAQR